MHPKKPAPNPTLNELTEAELLAREFTSADPETLDNISHDPPPNEEAEIESAYDMTDRSVKVRCVFCKYPNHFRGIVVRYHPSDTRRLVGRDCALTHFGVEFEQQLKEFDAAHDRQSFVRRRRAFFAASAKLIEEFRALKNDPAIQIHDGLLRTWRDYFSELSSAIVDALKRGDVLAVDREVRDEAEERERKERLGDHFESERQAAKAAGRRWQLTKIIQDNVGPVAGPLFFLPGVPIATRLDDLQTAIQQKTRLLASEDLRTGQIKAALAELGELRDQVKHEFDRLDDLGAAFAPDNLARIAKWANETTQEPDRRFAFSTGQPFRPRARYVARGSSITDLTRNEVEATLQFYRVPKRTLVDVFTEAISTEWEPGSQRKLAKRA